MGCGKSVLPKFKQPGYILPKRLLNFWCFAPDGMSELTGEVSQGRTKKTLKITRHPPPHPARDRVVQTAVVLLLLPIFEADFHENCFAYRPKRRAQQASDAIKFALLSGRMEIVETDLSGKRQPGAPTGRNPRKSSPASIFGRGDKSATSIMRTACVCSAKCSRT